MTSFSWKHITALLSYSCQKIQSPIKKFRRTFEMTPFNVIRIPNYGKSLQRKNLGFFNHTWEEKNKEDGEQSNKRETL